VNVNERSPEEEQAFAAGYTQALHDHAADFEQLTAQDAEIRSLHRDLATAQQDLDRLDRTVAALEEEAAGYFQQPREAGAFDRQLAERSAAYHARQEQQLHRATERLQDQRPDHPGGPIQWPEPQ
jgi:hypothetical protein